MRNNVCLLYDDKIQKRKNIMQKTNRRNFIKTGTALGGMMLLPKWSICKDKGPNSRLNVALIGVGGIGGASLSHLLKTPEANIVAFCDVDDARAASAYKAHPNIPRFRDFRVMLDKMDKDIDAVVVSTPDHMHYPISVWAMSKGKHVFCQKPLSRTIWEAEEMKRVAKETGVITQMGNQGHTLEGWRVLREWYDAGLIGQIEDIYCWTNRPKWPQGELSMPPAEPVPPTLDYDLWLGVAPYQPYNKKILPFKWRGIRNYGTGAAGDMGCHFLDVPYSAFDLGFPMKIASRPSPFNDYSWPSAVTETLTFMNKRGVDNRIRLHWYDGSRRPYEIKRVDKAFLQDIRNDNCTFIVGTKATIRTDEYGNKAFFYPREIMVDLKRSNALPPPTIKRSEALGSPQREWVLACLKGEQPPANFEYAAPFTQMVLLGMVSIFFPDTELSYIPSKMEFANFPDANKYLRSLYAYNESFLPGRI